MNTTDCIRLRRNLCRLDMKPCKEKCPLRKTKEEMEKVNEISFEVKGDFEKLREDFMVIEGVETIYLEKVNGELFPVANIERHPDCPKHIYEAWKRSLLNYE